MKTKKVSQRPIIPMPDYVRIFQVMHAVMGQVTRDRNRTCWFFSMTAAAILSHFYKKEARVLAGSAYYLLDDKSRMGLAITKFADGQLVEGMIDSDRNSNSGGFHCWLECEGQIIDFQAPLFGELLAEAVHAVSVSRQMFQKPKTSMSAAHDELEQAGDFYVQANMALTNDLVRSFLASPVQMDLLKVCMAWFTKPPKKISRVMNMQDDLGETHAMHLSEIDVTGAW